MMEYTVTRCATYYRKGAKVTRENDLGKVLIKDGITPAELFAILFNAFGIVADSEEITEAADELNTYSVIATLHAMVDGKRTTISIV